MKKIASPNELKVALDSILSAVTSDERPSRVALASQLEKLADALIDVSTPDKAAKYLRTELNALFPKHYVKVVGERGVGIEVALMDDESHAKEQLTRGYLVTPPNLMVKIVMSPGQGSNAWTALNVKPGASNPELDEAGVKPIRKLSGVSPEQGVAAILKWFKDNRSLLGA